MTTIGSYEFPDDLYYDTQHAWVRVEGNVATIGLTQFGQDIAGDIVYVEVPRVGRAVAKDEPFMSMESGKWVGRIKAPVGGQIVGANEEIEWESALVNQEPYAKGWLAKIEMANSAELSALLKADSPAFAAFMAGERAKYNK